MELHQHYGQQEVVSNSTKRAKKCVSSTKPKKPTVKDQQMHQLIYAEGGLPDNTPVYYKANGVRLLDGKKQGSGILCSCCNEEISASLFEVHAGKGRHKRPYENIFVWEGISLHTVSARMKINGNRLPVKNDDMCGVCQMGRESGDLLLCDGCPRSFHGECISQTRSPLAKWFCKYCQVSMKKCLESLHKHLADGINPIEDIVKRCVRVIDNVDKHDLVACSLCRSFDFCVDGFNDRTSIVCDQCELEFHIGCLRENYMGNLTELPPGSWFCSFECGRLNYVLKVLVSFGAQEVPASLVDNVTNLDLKWIIVHCKHALGEGKSLLAEAAKMFHEGFEPITDKATEMDFIDAMTYEKGIDAPEFAGVHCAMLTINSKVVTAGLFRVFGHEIGELPIVATSQPYQNKGYLKVFFTCFEKLLAFLKIKKLVVPAAEEAKAMWTDKFGFRKVTPMEQSEYRQKQTSMLAFSGTCLLEKKVPEARITFEDAVFFCLTG